MRYLTFILFVFLFIQCKNNEKNVSLSQNDTTSSLEKSEENSTKEGDLVKRSDNSEEQLSEVPFKEGKSSKSGDWVELSGKDGFLLDIKYATKDNFTKKVIYDCEACFLRPEVAQALINAQKEIEEKYGYGIKLLDCYRPRPFQQRLWDIMPDKNYVAPPAQGSMHSRGTAIDLTLVDAHGKELDMGTPFDYFGEEAHQDYKGHSDSVNRHRYILRSTMKKFGLEQIRTEWWHYSYRAKSYPLEDWLWPCNSN